MRFAAAVAGLISRSVAEFLAGAVMTAFLGRSEVPAVTASDSAAFRALVEALPCLKKYTFPAWARFPHAHAVFCSLLHRKRAPPPSNFYHRTMVPMDDGVEVALDWNAPPGDIHRTTPAPIVLICHGLAGDSLSPHIRILVRILADSGFSTVVYNRRGHGGTRIEPPQAPACVAGQHPIYPQHFDPEDFQAVVSHIKAVTKDRGIIGVGFSAGGNALACHLATAGADCGIMAGLVAGNAFDLWKAVQGMHSEARMLDSFLTHLMKGILRAHLPSLSHHHHPKTAGIDFRAVLKQTSLLGFESRFMPALRGFSGAEEYYLANSSLPGRLRRIAVPVLCLNSMDDPVVGRHLWKIPVEAAKENPNIISITTRVGSHVSWLQSAAGGGDPRSQGSWLFQLVLEFVEAISGIDLI